MSNIYVHTRQRTYTNVGVIWSDAVVFLKRSNKKCNCRNISDDTFKATISFRRPAVTINIHALY